MTGETQLNTQYFFEKFIISKWASNKAEHQLHRTMKQPKKDERQGRRGHQYRACDSVQRSCLMLNGPV
jgi:hypothetical protein